MKRANFPVNKERRRLGAKERQAAYDALTLQQKLVNAGQKVQLKLLKSETLAR